MADIFVGDNDHGDAVPPTDVLLEMIKTLRAERDEARREVCQWEHHWDKTASEQYYADKRGWDCYKEKNDND